MQDLFSPYSELNDSSEKKEFSCVKDHLGLMSKYRMNQTVKTGTFPDFYLPNKSVGGQPFNKAVQLG